MINKKWQPHEGVEVRILNQNGEEEDRQLTDKDGSINMELIEYTVIDDIISYQSPYTVIVNKRKEQVILNSNSRLTIRVK